MDANGAESVSARLAAPLDEAIARALRDAGGWLPFDRFMSMALYTPGLGYYSRPGVKLGHHAADGSDFVTAPELSPLFGQTLAQQVRQVLQALREQQPHAPAWVWEFGAGSGALAAQLLQTLGDEVQGYRIVEVSGALRARQAERLQPWRDRVQWVEQWPAALDGVVIGNEVLDAMPVQLLHHDGQRWWERGVVPDPQDGPPAEDQPAAGPAPRDDPATPPPRRRWQWADRETDLRPPGPGPWPAGLVTEIHPQAEAFVRDLVLRMRHAAAFFLDYGFPEAEYYHPQRLGGTLMCHRAHRADTDPLVDVGLKDITAHVNFSAVALAAQEAGAQVLGYTSQARFLMNCGLLPLLHGATPALLSRTQMLLTEHEMGELFKVLGFARGLALDALGFAAGDRSHTL